MTDYKEYMKTLEEQIQNKRARALVSEEINGHIEEQAKVVTITDRKRNV